MKTILAAITLSTLSALSLADATQFSVPPGQLTRAEVIAAIGTVSLAHTYGEATVFAQPQVASTLTRAQVLAEAAADRAARRHEHGDSSTLRFADEGRAVATKHAEAMAEAQGSTRLGDADRDDINLRTR